MQALPKGNQNELSSDDELIVAHLLKDEIFIESIEAEYGKIKALYPDWRTDKLVYEFVSGKSLCSDLSEIIRALKDINYIKYFEQ